MTIADSMEPHSHSYSVAWLVWFVVSIGWFLAMEVYALVTDWRNTLSANIWRFEHFQQGQAISHWTFPHFIFIALLALLDVWLLFHFALGWWRG